MTIIPGLMLAAALAVAGNYLAQLIGVDLLELPKSPISPIMMAILLGVLLRNTVRLPAAVEPGIKFSLQRILRLGIVLLGIRLSLGEVGLIGLKALPVILITVSVALVVVNFVSKRLGLSARMGSLIAVGTSICGATAIMATAPTIKATDEEVSYSVACIALFGMAAMLAYPFAAHWLFSGDPFLSGLFLGTAVHDTAQVAGAGLVYQQYFGEPGALDAATVTKLVRNLGMLIVIPLMSILYHRNSSEGAEPPAWYSMVPLFVIGFAMMSLLRTVGDMGEKAFGFMDPGQWKSMVNLTRETAGYCLAIAMAAVGLGTRISNLRTIGPRPLIAGLVSALIVGATSGLTLLALY